MTQVLTGASGALSRPLGPARQRNDQFPETLVPTGGQDGACSLRGRDMASVGPRILLSAPALPPGPLPGMIPPSAVAEESCHHVCAARAPLQGEAGSSGESGRDPLSSHQLL